MQVFIWKSKKKVCIQLQTMPTTDFVWNKPNLKVKKNKKWTQPWHTSSHLPISFLQFVLYKCDSKVFSENGMI